MIYILQYDLKEQKNQQIFICETKETTKQVFHTKLISTIFRILLDHAKSSNLPNFLSRDP